MRDTDGYCRRRPDSAADAGEERIRRAGRPRLSIVILPFLNLSGEASVDYLVDGIVDALITDLSSWLPGSFVISRSTAFTYKGRSVPIRQVGTELGVRYVLEGSVLVDPSRLRVNAQLIDAETDEHLWAERFDKERREILQAPGRDRRPPVAQRRHPTGSQRGRARRARTAKDGMSSIWSCARAR